MEEVWENPEARPEYRISEGRLYRHILHSLNFKETSPEQQWKICIPEPLRRSTMEKFHDAPTADETPGDSKNHCENRQEVLLAGVSRLDT